MKKYLVTYLAPASVIDDWKKTEPRQRKEAEEKMQGDWKKWMGDHTKMFADKGAGVGKTKRVTSRARPTQETTSCCMRSSTRSHTRRPQGRSKAIRTCRSRRLR